MVLGQVYYCANTRILRSHAGGRSAGFTLIELLVTVSIMAMIMAISLPSLASAKKRANYGRWQGYSHSLRSHPDLLVYFNFEHETHTAVLKNAAVGNPMDKTYSPEEFDGQIDSPDWSQVGRFPGKPALSFVPSLYTRGIKIEPTLGTTMLNQITVMAWVRYFGQRHGEDTIAENWASRNNNRVWSLGFDEDELCWQTSYNGRNSGRVKLKADVEDLYGQWIHVAATFDGQEVKLFVNGELRDSDEQSALHPSDRPIYIAGGGNNGNSSRLNGILDEVAIFRTGLSDTEIKQHYRMGRP